MKKDWLIFGAIGALIGGLIVWNLTASDVIYPGSRPGTTINNSAIDAHFIEQMIPHHEDAITMANLALEKSDNQDIRNLATNIIASQGKEIKQMQDWYLSWFGKLVPTSDVVMSGHMMQGSGMHIGMMGNQTDITKLEQAANFDQLFLEQMIPHHQMAVMMASMLQSATNREEMRQLAGAIIQAQTTEIELMRSWLE